jgi:hypothetical protein
MRRFLVVAVLLLAILAGRARADLVINGGFESASLSPWTTNFDSGSGDLRVVNGPFFAHSGSDLAEWLAFGKSFNGTISQTLTTTALQDYTLDFYASSPTNTTATLDVTFGGTHVASLSLPDDGFYHEYTYTVQATGGSTTLSFAGTTASLLLLDDVSVNPFIATPEPSTIALALSAVPIGLVAWLRRRKRTPAA